MIKRDPCKGLKNEKFLGGIAVDIKTICMTGGYVPDFMYSGLIPRLLSNPVTGNPIKISIDMFYPADQFLSNVHLDMSEAVIQCGRARRTICGGDFGDAIKYTKKACKEAIAYLDDDDASQSKYLQNNVNWYLERVKESIELAVCTVHALTTFKTMSGATFALAPALIRSAMKIKTAVPQSPMTGMFIIVLPWLYSPMVWCIFNAIFQLIGTWQLLIGLVAYAFGPMLFFIFGKYQSVQSSLTPTPKLLLILTNKLTLNRYSYECHQTL